MPLLQLLDEKNDFSQQELHFEKLLALIPDLQWIHADEFHQRGTPHLSEKHRTAVIDRSLAAIAEIHPQLHGLKVSALVSILPHLTGRQFDTVATEAAAHLEKALPQSMPHSEPLARIISALLPYLANEQQEPLVKLGLRWAIKMRQVEPQTFIEPQIFMFAVLIPYLPEVERPSACKIALTALENIVQKDHYSTNQHYIQAFLPLVPFLAESDLDQALTIAIDAKFAGTELLVALTPRLMTFSQQEQCLQAILSLKGELLRPRPLLKMIPLLQGHLQKVAIQQCYRDILTDQDFFIDVILTLLPYLTGQQQTHAFDVAIVQAERFLISSTFHGNQLERSEAEIMSDLLAHLPDTQQAQLLSEWTSLLSNRKPTNDTAVALAMLLPNLRENAQGSGLLRKIIADLLFALTGSSRNAVLALIASQEAYDKRSFKHPLFTQSNLTTEICTQITAHLIDVCQVWQWF